MSGIGKVNRFFVANGMSELREGGGYEISPMSNMDGEIGSRELIEYSDATGNLRRRFSKNKADRSKRRSSRQKRVDKFLADRNTYKTKKLAVDKAQVKTQQTIAENLGKTNPQETALLQSIASSTSLAPANDKKPMSKGLKISLIIGGVAVASIIGYVIYKKVQKK
jgi:hypothetical protein